MIVRTFNLRDFEHQVDVHRLLGILQNLAGSGNSHVINTFPASNNAMKASTATQIETMLRRKAYLISR
jgi:hypothetical protein